MSALNKGAITATLLTTLLLSGPGSSGADFRV